ncbi:MAG: DoxX family protein [Halobacteriovoraceae bacterium]|nr:DoxX family protein [Halobacteriovoraceae bacterium]
MKSHSVGLLVIRLGIGISMMAHGIPKLFSPEKWEFLGSQMTNLGVNFGFQIFGFLAGFAEGVGGLLIVLGLFFRFANAALVFTMIVAVMYHINLGHDFNQTSHAVELLVVFVGLMLTGPGTLSLKK